MALSKLHKPVFVIGLHRTGSTLLRNMLDANSTLAMATDEMDVSNPWKRTLEQDLHSFHRRTDTSAMHELVELIYSGNIHSTFWQEYPSLGIPRNRILERLQRSGTALPAVMTILLDEYRKHRQKARVGVKYPLHVSRADRLFQWFPGCKVVMLTRDVRAICASKLNDPATRRRKSLGHGVGTLVHYATLSLFVTDYLWSVRVYRRYRNCSEFQLIRYEDLVAEPELALRRLCEFCELPFEPAMLDVAGKPSSIHGKLHRGTDPERSVHWQRALGRFDRRIISYVARRGMNCFGYR